MNRLRVEAEEKRIDHDIAYPIGHRRCSGAVENHLSRRPSGSRGNPRLLSEPDPKQPFVAQGLVCTSRRVQADAQRVAKLTNRGQFLTAAQLADKDLFFDLPDNLQVDGRRIVLVE